MFKLPNGANGKAATTTPPETFFQQFAPVPNPIDPRQITLVPLPGTGIPMRDYFAAKAMHALLATDEGSTDPEMYPINARFAYQMADAMLKARAEKPAEENGFPYTDGKL